MGVFSIKIQATLSDGICICVNVARLVLPNDTGLYRDEIRSESKTFCDQKSSNSVLLSFSRMNSLTFSAWNDSVW